MLHSAKTSLISRFMGFVRDSTALGGWKKKGFTPPPPKHTHTHTHFTDHKTTGLNIVCCIKSLYVEVLLSLPPSLAAPSPLPAPHRLGNFFAFPIPWLVSDSTQFKLSFTRKVCFFPPYFWSKPIFDTQYFSPHNSGHSYTCSKLPRSSSGFASTLLLQRLQSYGFLKEETKSKREVF